MTGSTSHAASFAPLAIRGVSKAYDGRSVLNNVTFDLLPGEMFGLIGLNGVGKTTLIKIILHLTFADRGVVDIMGVPSTEDRARQVISYLPEKFQPARTLKGMEYLSLALSYFGKKLDKDAARTLAEALDFAPENLDKRISAYSKGMGQKLGLVGAFLVDTPLLILDEPMSGLDPSARIKLKNQLLRAKAEGKTIFFSSHILADIEEICDRIGIIHDAELRFIGTPGEFIAKNGDVPLEQAFLRSIGS